MSSSLQVSHSRSASRLTIGPRSMSSWPPTVLGHVIADVPARAGRYPCPYAALSSTPVVWGVEDEESWADVRTRKGGRETPAPSQPREGGWTAPGCLVARPGTLLCIPVHKLEAAFPTSCRAVRQPYRGPAACTGPSGA